MNLFENEEPKYFDFKIPRDLYSAVKCSVNISHMYVYCRFDPDRFLPENAEKRPRYAFVPFGFGGGRQCPGYRITYVVLTMMLTSILRRYKLRLAPGQGAPDKFRGLLTSIKGDIVVQVEDRI